jgi:hypothetical protein
MGLAVIYIQRTRLIAHLDFKAAAVDADFPLFIFRLT